MSEQVQRCVNCHEVVSSNFCPNCGQKYPPKKINLITLYTDFQSRIYGLDGMLPRTLVDLTVRPGKVAKAFIEGNRVMYVGPVGYFFLTITIFLLIMSWLDVDFYEYGMSNNPFVMDGNEKQVEFAKGLMRYINSNQRIFAFLVIPITGFWLKVFFRKSGLNFLESMVPAFYVAGHVEWISILSLLSFSFFGFAFHIFQVPFNMMLFAFMCVGLFPYNTKLKAFLKGGFVSVLSFISFQFLIVLIGILYLFFNPEILESLKP